MSGSDRGETVKVKALFGQNVRKYRLLNGMRLDSMTVAAGLSYSYLSTGENRRGNISITNAQKIALSLKVPMAVLFIE